MAIVLLLIPFAWQRLQANAWRLTFVLDQRECMNFTLPPDRVVYEEDDARANELTGGRTVSSDFITVTTSESIILGYFARAPAALEQFAYPNYSLFSGYAPPYFLFVHGLRARGGEERFVHIGLHRTFGLRASADTDLAPGKHAEQRVLQWTVTRPGSLFTPPRHLALGDWGSSQVWINMPKPLRIYAGQLDPADPSHVRFVFALPQEILHVDGWLQSDDQMKFTVQSAPSSAK